MQPLTNLLKALLGHIAYTAPPWMHAIGAFRKKTPATFWLLVLVLLVAAIGSWYYLSLPGPVRVTAVITPPALPADGEEPPPSVLMIEFDYVRDDDLTDHTIPEGAPSVARIDRMDKPLDGIVLTPALAGRWQWADDRRLEFIPESPWPAGTRYRVDFPDDIFSPETHQKKTANEFETPAFTAAIDDLAFYQDPTDSAIRRVTAALSFSHPVDGSSLEQYLTLAMRPSDEDIQTPPSPVGFTLTYTDDRRTAYLSSDPLTLPPRTNTLRLTVDRGVMAAAGGTTGQHILSDTVSIPDRFSFLKVTAADAHIVTNQRQEPEQVLTLSFTDEITAEELTDKLTVYLLPEINHRRGTRNWESPRDVHDPELAAAETVSLRMLPNPRPASTDYHFVMDTPENRYLYLRIAPDLSSINGFVHASFYDTVLATPSYPRQVQLAGDGSLLAASGRQHLGIMARGLNSLKISVGRLLPGQITHLITQTDGDIRDPYFSNPQFSEADIAAFTRTLVDLKSLHPGRANYTTLDLSEHLAKEKSTYGLFFVSVQGWDKARNRPVYGVSDQRLILITDLGLMAKNNADGSHEIFVQSLVSGRPVNGAKIRLLGKNGLPLFVHTTDSRGHAHIPVTRDFKAEQQPSVYLVRTDTDVAFVPFSGHSRQVDQSRFDVGGVRSRQGRHQEKTGRLNAYLFSDRGIYRPGETVHLGAIVKNAPLDNVSGIPLEAVIQGPRHNVVKTEKIMLPDRGFTEVNYPTAATADTGRYRVSLYLVRDNRHRGRMLGSTAFTVEEFVPDTMKISATLDEASDQGWTTTPVITARVALKNLFGAPAQNRRVQARIQIRPARFHFEDYTDYHFVDPFADNGIESLRIDEALPPATTDADGLARFDIPLDRFREGTYRLDLFMEGFDPAGGRSVSTHNRVLISPLPHIVGFKSDGDLGFIHAGSTRQVDWIAIDARLATLDLPDLILRRLEIQHLSTLVKQPDGTFAYQTVDTEREVDRSPFSIAAGGSSSALATDAPGDWALEVVDPEGRRLARLTYSVVGHANLTGRLEKAARLQLKLEKNDVNAGDTIRMSITAPYVGAGLISIESDRVYAFKWFRTTTESTLESIRLPETLEGNAYVNVCFVRDAGSKEIFTSPLSTAVAPVSIDRSRRQLDVSLQMDDVVRPGEPMTIGYKASQPSRMVIFAVDAGILQVAGYRPPAPLDHFLRKHALEVTTLQMLDLILPEFELMRTVMASGGGAMRAAVAGNLNPFTRRTERPAVFWSGIVDGGPDPRTVAFTVPDTFAGNLTVMAVAVADDAVGTATGHTLVRGPFVLSPTVLLQAAPGDAFQTTVGVANLVEGSGPQAPVDIRVTASSNLEIVGSDTRRLEIDEGGESRAAFTIRCQDDPGAASLTFHASSGNAQTQRTAGLSIRPAMPFRTTFTSGYEKDGSVRLPLTRRLFPRLAEQKVSASATPLVLVDALTAYLEHFPHGCTEQVVSQVFPLVGLLSHPAYAAGRPDIEDRFAVLMDRLRRRQQADGGFSFWPGGTTAAGFPSVYVMHFLIESRDLGLTVPADMLQRGTDYLGIAAQADSPDLAAAGVRAQAIYLLTRLGRTTTNQLVHLQETLERNFEKTWKTDLTAVYLAATYRLLQKDEPARQLAGGYRLGRSGKDISGDFNHPLTRNAQALYLLSRHFEDLANAIDGDELLDFVTPIFRGETNTIGASYAILALGAYGQRNRTNGEAEAIGFAASPPGGDPQALEVRAAPFPSAAYPMDTRAVHIDAAGPVFYLNVRSGFDRDRPTESLRSGLEIYREFTDDDGAVIETFTQGQDVTVHLRIRSLNASRVSNVAIVDLLPGGFEVVRHSVPRTVGSWQADYVDVREDRVVFYGSVTTSVRELIYRARVTAPGTFCVPAAVAASMYDRSLRASTAAGQLTVMPAP